MSSWRTLKASRSQPWRCDMGAQMLRKKSNPQPGKLATKGGYLFSKGKSFKVLPENRIFFKNIFFPRWSLSKFEGGDQLGAGPIHGLNHPSYSKKTSLYLYTYVSQICVFQVFFKFPFSNDGWCLADHSRRKSSQSIHLWGCLISGLGPGGLDSWDPFMKGIVS